MKELNLDDVKKALTEMGIPYREENVPQNLISLTSTFGYTVIPIIVDLTNIDALDAELGVIVQNKKLDFDDGVYIFTVLHSGQAGFMVIEPSTRSRAPLIRKVSGNVVNAVSGIEFPPLMPFDLVEITAHALAGTFMKMIMESCHIPKEYEQAFLHLYMPKFLANVGMYFVGAAKEDGSPMVYEEIANMEPMMVWNSIRKGATDKNESNDAGDAEAGDGKDASEETDKDKAGKEE